MQEDIGFIILRSTFQSELKKESRFFFFFRISAPNQVPCTKTYIYCMPRKPTIFVLLHMQKIPNSIVHDIKPARRSVLVVSILIRAFGGKIVFTWRHGRHIGVQNNATVAILVFQENPVGIKLFSHAKTFFSFKKFAQLPITRVKIYKCAYVCNYLLICLFIYCRNLPKIKKGKTKWSK